MAKEGKPKPESLTKYGRLLYRYTSKLLSSYDESFTKKITKLRPDWFIKSSEIMKQTLIKMAKKGKTKPRNKTKERDALNRYTDKNSNSYDESFTKLIKKLRPDWFMNSIDVNKQNLIKMAKIGKNRPGKKTKEGMALERYINRNSNSYDESFAKLIKKLRPDWFRKKITPEERVLTVIKQNPGINASGMYHKLYCNINSTDLHSLLEKLRKADKIHFKIVDSSVGYSQKWYAFSQTKEKREMNDIWINIKDIQEEIKKYCNKKSSLTKIKNLCELFQIK